MYEVGSEIFLVLDVLRFSGFVQKPIYINNVYESDKRLIPENF